MADDHAFLSNELDGSLIEQTLVRDNPILLGNEYNNLMDPVRVFSIEIPLDEGAAWTKLNADQRGFYRVNYDAEGWRRLGEALIEDNTVSGT